MTTTTQGNAALLEAMVNLTKFHREHEKFYASSAREFAVTLQRHARNLQALADRWSTTDASTRAVLSPYEGAEESRRRQVGAMAWGLGSCCATLALRRVYAPTKWCQFEASMSDGY